MRLAAAPGGGWLVAAAMLAALAFALPLARHQVLARLSVIDRLESPLLDLRFLLVGQKAAPPDIAIVAIDETVVHQLGAYPLPRATLAELVRAIGRSQPKVVGLDMLFLDPGPGDGDRALAQALAEVKGVIGAVALFEDEASTPGRFDVPRAATLVRPIDALAGAAAVGITNVSTDSGGTPRHAPLLVEVGEQLVPSFVLLVAATALGSEPAFSDGAVTIGRRTIRLDRRGYLPLGFFGPHGTIPTISASEVLNEKIGDPRLFGKSVIIGATVNGGGDNFATPFDPVVPGAEVLATAIAQLTDGPSLIRNRTTRWIDAAATLSLPLVAIGLMAWRRVGIGLALTALIAAAWLIGTLAAFANHYWLNIAAPLAAMLPAAFGFAACRMVYDARLARGLQRQAHEFSRFQSPLFARKLAEDPDFLQRPIEQTVAILFVDLSGFTGLAEAIGPLATENLLRFFHGMIVECVAEGGGAVMTYLGDGAMAAFGLPDPSCGDAAAALCTARHLQRVLSLRQTQAGPACDLPGMRIGVHAGPVVFSRLGHATHQQITASGDTVNVASRLMETAKQFDCGIVVSEALADQAVQGGADLADFSEAVDVAIRGRSGHVKARLWRYDAAATAGTGEALHHG